MNNSSTLSLAVSKNNGSIMSQAVSRNSSVMSHSLTRNNSSTLAPARNVNTVNIAAPSAQSIQYSTINNACDTTGGSKALNGISCSRTGKNTMKINNSSTLQNNVSIPIKNSSIPSVSTTHSSSVSAMLSSQHQHISRSPDDSLPPIPLDQRSSSSHSSFVSRSHWGGVSVGARSTRIPNIVIESTHQHHSNTDVDTNVISSTHHLSRSFNDNNNSSCGNGPFFQQLNDDSRVKYSEVVCVSCDDGGDHDENTLGGVPPGINNSSIIDDDINWDSNNISSSVAAPNVSNNSSVSAVVADSSDSSYLDMSRSALNREEGVGLGGGECVAKFDTVVGGGGGEGLSFEVYCTDSYIYISATNIFNIL